MKASLIPARSLFRFSVACPFRADLFARRELDLDDDCRLPQLEELEGRATTIDVRAAWSEEGLAFQVDVWGKSHPVWCRANRLDESDGFQVWIDTRDVHTVHRASRFCHRFVFLPAGAGSAYQRPMQQWLPINRAKQQPGPIPDDAVSVRSKIRDDGYRLDAMLRATALTGFDPFEHTRIGFNYQVRDRELRGSTFSAGAPLPFDDDPSTWGTVELVR